MQGRLSLLSSLPTAMPDCSNGQQEQGIYLDSFRMIWVCQSPPMVQLDEMDCKDSKAIGDEFGSSQPIHFIYWHSGVK